MNPRSPFYILELSPDASPGEIERQGRKLIGLLELGAGKGKSYTCPLGTFPRDATMVREAMAALRDPKKRLKESCVVKLLSPSMGPPKAPGGRESLDASKDAPHALGVDDEALDAPFRDAFRVGYRGL